MPNLLFVDSCPRGEASRTLRLGENFLRELDARVPGAWIVRENLNARRLTPIDAETLAYREARCDARDFSDAFFAPARALMEADCVIIAAPYWDLSFPSELKVWVEHLWVRNLTFHYEDDRCVGHAGAKACVFLSTSGSPVGENDHDAAYLRSVMQALGIPAFRCLRAEGLDLVGNDAGAILREAERRCAPLAEEISGLLLR